MSEDELCGYETAESGEPCKNPATEGERCWIPAHQDQPDEDAPSPGRKTKLSHQRQERIATALEAGVGFKAACEAAGISEKTGHRWLKKGEEQEEGVYQEFRQRVTRARGHGKQDLAQSIVQMARENGDPRTLLKYLEFIEGGELSQEDEDLAGLNLVVPEVAVRDDE